jgi:hypothetical protein
MTTTKSRESPLIRGGEFFEREELEHDEIEKGDIKIRLV